MLHPAGELHPSVGSENPQQLVSSSLIHLSRIVLQFFRLPTPLYHLCHESRLEGTAKLSDRFEGLADPVGIKVQCPRDLQLIEKKIGDQTDIPDELHDKNMLHGTFRSWFKILHNVGYQFRQGSR